MKNLIVCLVLLFALSCSKAVVPEQKVFENLPSCCKKGDNKCELAFTNGYVFIDISGELYGGGYNQSGVLVYNMIVSDTLVKIAIPNGISPWFEYCRPELVCCNMPTNLLYSKRSRKVKFTCRVPYYPLPLGMVECGGLGVELIRIELVD